MSTEPERCLCHVTAPDEFGNRDLVENPDCPFHGEWDEVEAEADE